MISTRFKVSLIKGDGIGIAVAESAQQIVDAALKKSSSLTVNWQDVQAGARYFSETGLDIEPGAEQEMMKSDAIFLGAIGLPAVRQSDGTEISPHLRLREIYELYAGVRPVKAYANAPQRLSDPMAAPLTSWKKIWPIPWQLFSVVR
jgi:3-isopropylmalate dehydrogenase